jgi:ATP-dependent DNA ligase
VGKGCVKAASPRAAVSPRAARADSPRAARPRAEALDSPVHVIVPDNEFDKMEVMKYKELRPREVLSDPSKLTKYIGWYMSEKIDGWQALWDGKGNLYTKSYKRTFAVPEEWLRLLPDIPLAGEIKIKGKPATSVASLQKSSPLWKDAQFFIFDLPGPKYRILPFKTRVNDINKIVRDSCRAIPNCPLVASGEIIIENIDHLLHYYHEILRNKGEGLVLTNPESVYQIDGKRSSERVKLKGRNDSEGIVVGHNLGGKVGEMKSLEIDFGGVIFSLGIGFNKDDRDNYKTKFPIGTVVKFSYRDLSVNGKPKEARFLEVRKDL